MNQFRTVALLSLLSIFLITVSYSLIGGLTGMLVGVGLAVVTNVLLFSF